MNVNKDPNGRLKILARLVKENGWTSGAELGVLAGALYTHLLAACPALTLYGVDRWDTEFYRLLRKNPPPRLNADLEAHYERLRAWTAENAAGRGHLIREDTANAAALFEDGELDFVFIDGGHSYQACLADIRAWRPKAKVLLGHDHNEKWPGVVRAVREEFTEIRVFLDDSVWMAVK